MNALNEPRESRRRDAIREYGMMDTPPEAAYDDLCRLAALVCSAPIAAISLTDVDRQWIKAAVGIGTGSVPKDASLCAKVAEAGRPIEVPDAARDDRFCGSPFVRSESGIRFYAGFPLVTPSGVAVGALCVADVVARTLEPAQREAMAILGREAVARMELRRTADESERARRRLAVQEVLLRTIFQVAPEGLLVTGLDGSIQSANPAGLVLLDAEEMAALAGRNLAEFAAGLPEALARAREGGTAKVELELHGLRGTRRPSELQAVPMRDPAGGIASILVVLRDVTALRQKEHELRHAQKMEAMGRLAGGVAHDFNNILTAIMGYGELLLEEARGKGAAEGHAQEILKAAESARRLCRQMLTFSLGQGAPRRTVLNPGEVLRDLEGMLRPILGERIQLRWSSPDLLWSVRADRAALEQVLLNLAVNARDAMPEGGALRIALRNQIVGAGEEPPPGALAAGPYVAISVSDTGRGMPPEVLAHLFEPYFTTKESSKGGGLGLSIIFGIVGQAGGHVDVASRPGEGSTFTVYLPAVEPAPSLPAPPRVAPVILLVEDAPDVRRMVRALLAARGHVVVAAVSAEDALAELAARRTEIALLLTDLSLPGIDGSELAVRARDLVPGLKVIAMSDDPEPAPEVARRVDRFVAKPFAPDELIRAVDAALGV